MTSPTINQINQRYTILDKLGEGSFGAVYRAHDRLTGDTVALKHLTVSNAQLMFLSQGDQLRLDLAQEFRTLASLRHPHIISVLDYGFDQHHKPYITMELLENPRTILEAGSGQSIATQVDLLIELLQALIYLHRRGVLHRDLKPANVLVTEQGKVKVLDFGLSTQARQGKSPGGTVLYMAPETLRSQPIGYQTDLFAVGILAYQLLTGRYPFDRRSPSLVVSSILHHTPDFTAIDNPQLASVVATCLRKILRRVIRMASKLSKRSIMQSNNHSPKRAKRFAKATCRPRRLWGATLSWRSWKAHWSRCWLDTGRCGWSAARAG